MVSNPSNKVKTEAINEVILRLLGLNPGVELDYQTYFNIIKKKLAIGRLVGKELPREEDELLREELKKVRAIKDKGLRFKVKTTKTKVSTGASPGPGAGGASPKTGAIVKATTAKIVPQKIIPVNVKDVTEKKEEKVGGFDQIKKTLNSILGVLSSKFKFDKKQSDQERKEKETEKRSKRESGLEGFRKGISAISGAAKKMLAPFQSIIDRIWRFIFFTLLGRAFTQLMDWLGDPANKKKIEVLGRFLKDWWPTLLGAAILFFTPFGKFVRVTLRVVGSFAGKLVKLIPRIAKAVAGLGRFASTNPLATLITTTSVAGTLARTGERERLNPELARQRESVEATQKDPSAPWYKKLGGFFAQQELTTGQQQQGIVAPVPGALFNVGGEVPKLSTGYDGIDSTTGQKVSGFGPDTQMIIAQPGEVVMNKKTVDAVGADNLLALNRQYGGSGANKPKMGKLYNTGGIVGMQGGDNILTPWKQSFAVPLKSGTIPLPKIQGGGIVGMQNGGQVKYSSGTKEFGEIPLIAAAMSAGIKGRELSAFLAQMSHETGGFRWSRELGRGKGQNYAGGPDYHGRGYTQLTHNYNYKHFGDKLGVDLVKDPDLLLKDPKLSAKVAIEYWKERVRPKVKDWNDVFQVSSAINNPSATGPSDINHYQDRVDRTRHYNQVLPSLIQKYQPKTDPKANQQRLINKRPWWDKFGWFGGASKNIKKKQGGGKIDKNKTMRLGASLINISPIDTDLPRPMTGFRDLAEVQYQNNQNRKVKGLRSGGFIKENTGMNIKGATADRQLTALQPGEYVLPVDTVSRLGTPLIDKLVAMTDSNSSPAKLGMKTKNVPNITPLSRGSSGGMMTLPPIIQSTSGAGSVGNSSGAGSKVPAFSVVSPRGAEEIAETASILGIVG